MSKLKLLLIAAVSSFLISVPLYSDSVSAVAKPQVDQDQAAEAAQGNDAAAEIQKGVNDIGGRENKTDLPTFIKSIVNILLFLLGAIAVVMIVVGGIRYTISNGDQGQVKAAKDTILYAVIGLVVAILAYAIVNFIVSGLASS